MKLEEKNFSDIERIQTIVSGQLVKLVEQTQKGNAKITVTIKTPDGTTITIEMTVEEAKELLGI